MMLQKIFITFILCNIPCCVVGDMKIEITHGTDTAYPIAIVPFTIQQYFQNNLHSCIEEDIGSIIAADLRNSGKFNTLPISYLPHQPTKLSDIIPMFWEKIGINTIVLGSINIDNNYNYIISYQLIDTSKNPALIILENQFSTKENNLRYIAHTISNEIFEKLTGIQGAFCARIAYISCVYNIKYLYTLYISDYDGYNQIAIHQSSEPLMSPSWSADNKKIAYVTFTSGYSKLIIQTIDTGLINNVINFPNHNGAPAFSPDGQKLVFSSSKSGSLNLYIFYLSSGKICQITNNRHNNTEPSWFPDSTNLAYTSDQGGTPQVYKIDTNNTDNIQRISWLYGHNQKPYVSPHGNFIIMINRSYGKQNISKLNLLTAQEEILTMDDNILLPDTPCVAPNGTMLIYSAIVKQSLSSNDNSNKSILALMSTDGKFKAYLTGSSENIRFPTWSSTCLKE